MYSKDFFFFLKKSRSLPPNLYAFNEIFNEVRKIKIKYKETSLSTVTSNIGLGRNSYSIFCSVFVVIEYYFFIFY